MCKCIPCSYVDSEGQDRGVSRSGSFLADGYFLAISSPGENEMGLLFLFLQRQKPPAKGLHTQTLSKSNYYQRFHSKHIRLSFGILEVINFVGTQVLGP